MISPDAPAHAVIMLVVGAAVLFQFIAALLALRLIPLTGKRTAWLLVAVAIALMTERRFESLVNLVAGGPDSEPNVFFEIVGLVISVFMMAGIYLIRPVFSEMAASREELRRMNERLSSLSGEQKKLIAELQDALANVKTLKGLLPICASCKKVRDDKGYWHQVEVYVRDRSEAEFTHGICPECEAKYYEQFPYLKGKK
jgi:hypothetical protein